MINLIRFRQVQPRYGFILLSVASFLFTACVTVFEPAPQNEYDSLVAARLQITSTGSLQKGESWNISGIRVTVVNDVTGEATGWDSNGSTWNFRAETNHTFHKSRSHRRRAQLLHSPNLDIVLKSSTEGHPVIVAAIQMRSGTNAGENRNRASQLIEQAVSAGAELVSLPESFSWLGPDGAKSKNSESIPGPSSDFLSELAKRHSVLVHGGSFFESGPNDQSCYNSTLFIRADGSVSAHYRKIHLFDAVVDGERYYESDTVMPGDTPVVAEERDIRFGLSVCYDLRFPELYRALADGGAHAVFVPAAFTNVTGKAHWEILLRARAIENQVYIIAAAQVGRGPDGRQRFGHSMIVDPWGEILAQAGGEHEEVITARMDMDKLRQIRNRLPALAHRRMASPGAPTASTSVPG